MRPLTPVLTVTALLALGVGPAGAQGSVHGAWRIVETWGHNPQSGEWRTENVQPSVFLFMDGYYSIAYVRGEEARPLMPEDAIRRDLTAEQAAAVWIPYTSNSGTHEITQTTIVTRPIVAVWPNFMEGGSAVYTYSVDGDKMQLTFANETVSWNAKLKRLP